jgi:hypothetical protein
VSTATKTNSKTVGRLSKKSDDAKNTAAILKLPLITEVVPLVPDAAGGVADLNDDRRHPGGDTRAEHAENLRRVRAVVDEHLRTKTPFEANPRRPNKPDMASFARKAGVKREVLLRLQSESRLMVEAAVEHVGVVVRVRTEKTAPRLCDLTESGVARLRAEFEAEGIPSEIHVKAMRETAHLIAKCHHGGMRTDAAVAISQAVATATAGSLRLSQQQKAALERLVKYLEDLQGDDGLPQSFAEALAFACAQADLDLTTVARLADIRPQTLINYAAGRRNPDPRNKHKIARVEEITNLTPGSLVSRIKSKRAGRGRLPASTYPEKLRGKEHARLRGEISRLLPADIAAMEEKQRHQVIWGAHDNVMKRKSVRRRRGALLKMPYALKQFPPKLEADFTALAKHKEAAVPMPGMLQGHRWKPGTTQRRRDQISYLAGFLTSDAAGDRKIALKAIDLTLFCDPENAQAYHVFKTGRGASTESNAGITGTDADLMTFAASLFGTDGWMRQSRDFTKRAGLNVAGWQKRCDEIEGRYRKLDKDLRKNVVNGKEPFENVLPILDMKNPMAAVNLLIRGLQDDVDKMKEDAAKLPQSLQDLVWTQIQALAGLRPATWKDLTWAPDNSGHLRRDDRGWYLDIPKAFFKNEKGKALEADFYRRLPDQAGLYRNLDRYLRSARYVLTDGMKTRLLFIYGRKNLELDGSNRAAPGKRTTRFYENALAVRVRAFTKRHLAWNEATGTGIKGIVEFGPTAFRHILATAILKSTGSFTIAADAIADSEQTARKYYTRFEPSDRREDLDGAIAAINAMEDGHDA